MIVLSLILLGQANVNAVHPLLHHQNASMCYIHSAIRDDGQFEAVLSLLEKQGEVGIVVRSAEGSSHVSAVDNLVERGPPIRHQQTPSCGREKE